MKGRRDDSESAVRRAGPGDAASAPGKQSRIDAAYPMLAQAMRTGDAAPTIHDAATAAVENKGSGVPVDGAIAAQVGAHVGHDLSGARVHQDAMAKEASAAMGARAFAHGSDVFLGARESPTDLGLMAHELTHVAQQGGGAHAPQRKVNVGDSNSPAEAEADAVAAAVTGGAAPTRLLVDSGAVTQGQMLKAGFVAELREQVATVADAQVGSVYDLIGQEFERLMNQPAAEVEALVARLVPASRGARSAGGLIAPIVARVREGFAAWRATGVLPPDVGALMPGVAMAMAGSAGPSPAAAQLLRAPDGRETLASLEASLGAGAPVDGGIASRMSAELGVDVGGARIHTGPVAAAKAAEAGALAFAAGGNIVMGAGAPGAGTITGDALLAHELAHTAQQSDAARDPAARRMPLGEQSEEAEAQADEGAAGALATQHGADKGKGKGTKDWARTGLQLQRCDPPRHVAPAGGTFAMVAPVVRAARDAAARNAALGPGIIGANQRLADLQTIAGSPSSPIGALRRRIIAETGVGSGGRALDANPYVSLRASHVEAAWRAWAENPTASAEPWTLLAIWMKEGLSAAPAPNTISASDTTDAKAIYRSQYYYQNMGADHYIHFTAAASGDNVADFAPGSGAAHDASFRAGITAQVAAGRLPRDISAEINAELTVAAAGPGSFTVTQGGRFQQLSLMLVDAYWRENRAAATTDLAAHGTSATGDDLDAMTYMRWNMGNTRFNSMLGRSMTGNRDPDGSTPSLPTWALHRQVRTGEWDQPRANAIRFQFYEQAYRYIYEAGY